MVLCRFFPYVLYKPTNHSKHYTSKLCRSVTSPKPSLSFSSQSPLEGEPCPGFTATHGSSKAYPVPMVGTISGPKSRFPARKADFRAGNRSPGLDFGRIPHRTASREKVGLVLSCTVHGSANGACGWQAIVVRRDRVASSRAGSRGNLKGI